MAAHFRDLMDAAPVAAFVKDSDGRYIYATIHARQRRQADGVRLAWQGVREIAMNASGSGKPDCGTIARSADQRVIDADQTASDADQTASDADQTASDRDEADAASDQRAADRDQANADRQTGGRFWRSGRGSLQERAQRARPEHDQSSIYARRPGENHSFAGRNGE